MTLRVAIMRKGLRRLELLRGDCTIRTGWSHSRAYCTKTSELMYPYASYLRREGRWLELIGEGHNIRPGCFLGLSCLELGRDGLSGYLSCTGPEAAGTLWRGPQHQAGVGHCGQFPCGLKLQCSGEPLGSLWRACRSYRLHQPASGLPDGIGMTVTPVCCQDADAVAGSVPCAAKINP